MIMVFHILQFSDIYWKALNMGICTHRGQWEYIESNMRWLPHTYAIFVITSHHLFNFLEMFPASYAATMNTASTIFLYLAFLMVN